MNSVKKNGTVIFHDPISGHFQNYLEQLLLLYSYPQLNRDWHAASCISSMLTLMLTLVNQSISMPVSRIGMAVGIPDANNFTNLFKRKVGMTPAAYRRDGG